MFFVEKIPKISPFLDFPDQRDFLLSRANAISSKRPPSSINSKNQPTLFCRKNLQENAIQINHQYTARFFFPYEFHLDDNNLKLENCRYSSQSNIKNNSFNNQWPWVQKFKERRRSAKKMYYQLSGELN